MRGYKYVKGKRKAIPLHAVNMQIVSTCACPLILKPNIKWWSVINFTPRLELGGP
jgi:hypothetical protein